MTGLSQGRGPKSPFISPSSGPILDELEHKIQTPAFHPFLMTLFPPPYLSHNFLFPLLPSLKKLFGFPSQDCRFCSVGVSSHPTMQLHLPPVPCCCKFPGCLSIRLAYRCHTFSPWFLFLSFFALAYSMLSSRKQGQVWSNKDCKISCFFSTILP